MARLVLPRLLWVPKWFPTLQVSFCVLLSLSLSSPSLTLLPSQLNSVCHLFRVLCVVVGRYLFYRRWLVVRSQKGLVNSKTFLFILVGLASRLNGVVFALSVLVPSVLLCWRLPDFFQLDTSPFHYRSFLPYFRITHCWEGYLYLYTPSHLFRYLAFDSCTFPPPPPAPLALVSYEHVMLLAMPTLLIPPPSPADVVMSENDGSRPRVCKHIANQRNSDTDLVVILHFQTLSQ